MKDLSVVLSSFLLIGALAASISTAATAHIGATSTAVRDIYQRVFRPNATAKELLGPSKVILLALGGLTWLLSYYPGGPIYLFAFASAWLGPPSILIMMGMIWPRFNDTGALAGVVIGMATMAILTFTELMKIYSISPIMHIGVAGMIATVIPAVIGSLIGKPRYYGESGWSLQQTGQEKVDLNEFDLKVLEMLRYGHETMSEITDALQVDSRHSNAGIEKLDRGGFLKRRALWGSNFYAFDITDRGMEKLPPLSEHEAALAKDSLKPMYLRLLSRTAVNPEELPEFVKQENLSSLEVSSAIGHLVRKGYLTEGGLWRRTIGITEKGRSILAKYA